MTDPEMLLDGEGWLSVVDNTEHGEEITAPIGLHNFIRGQSTVIGAPTGVGKTAIGLQAFRWVVENDHSGAYCTLEMSPALLFQRFWPQFGSEEACREWIKQHPAYVSHSYLDYQEVEQIIRRGFDFVVIDHIHELPFDGHEELGKKVRRLAALAPETNTAILMLSQMRRRDPMFDPGPPTTNDFSWTKAIEEVNAVCQAIWQPDPSNQNKAELLCLKSRFSPKNFPVQLELDGKTITFQRNY